MKDEIFCSSVQVGFILPLFCGTPTVGCASKDRLTGMKSSKDYKTQLELLKEDKHNMEIKIGEMEIDNNRFKVEIDELRVARNQVN